MVDIVPDLLSLYDDLLLDAAYSGLPFAMLDSRDEAGRRVIRTLFPGRDDAAWQDLGVLDGQIKFNGVLIGDDYVAQAEALRQAFRTAGPATLLHPWLGEIQVVLAQPASFHFDQKKLRAAYFEAVVWPYVPRIAQAPDTLSALLAAGRALEMQVRAWLRVVLAPAALALTVVGYVQSFAGRIQAQWDAIVSGAPSTSGIYAASASAIAGLSDVATIPPGAGYADAVADAIGAPSAAIAGASNPVLPSAVGPGDTATIPAAADPRVTAAALLSFAALAAAEAGTLAPAAAMSLAARVYALTAAVRAASDIPYTSQQEAITWRDQVATALDGAASAASLVAATAPVPGGQVWSGLVSLRAAWMSDMAATIGRLPAVQTVILPRAVPLWLLAQYVSGDSPAALVSVYQDIAARNAVAHPGMVPAGPVEILA